VTGFLFFAAETIPMIWPFNSRARKSIARIEVTGVIAAATRKRVLKALEEIEERQFPALLLRIDSPGGTVGDSQEIYYALRRLQEKVKIVASLAIFPLLGGCTSAWAPTTLWPTRAPLPAALA
jgi:protease-4